jgi:hypothetical protein
LSVSLASANAWLVGALLLIGSLTKAVDRKGVEVARKTLLGDLVSDAWVEPAWRGIALLEAAVGIGLIGAPVGWMAMAAAGFLAPATGLSAWSLARGDARACGCFGRASAAVLTWRTPIRSALMLAVVGTVAATSLRHQPLWIAVSVLLFEGALLVAISPEVPWIYSRLPRAWLGFRLALRWCAPARIDPTVAEALHATDVWARIEPFMRRRRPLEKWNDGDWTFVTYAARVGGAPATAVIGWSSDELSAALVDEATGDVFARANSRAKLRMPPLLGKGATV